MSKTSESPVTKSPEVASVAPPSVKKKTHTNWQIFEDAGFIPVKVRCEGYRSSHPADLSCHSNFPPTAENVVRHLNPEHGGGWFHIKFRISQEGAKKSELWRGLEEAGVELQDFHCPHCREAVPVSPRRIIYHLQNHPGALRVNLFPQELCMTLGYTRPDEDELDPLYGDAV